MNTEQACSKYVINPRQVPVLSEESNTTEQCYSLCIHFSSQSIKPWFSVALFFNLVKRQDVNSESRKLHLHIFCRLLLYWSFQDTGKLLCILSKSSLPSTRKTLSPSNMLGSTRELQRCFLFLFLNLNNSWTDFFFQMQNYRERPKKCWPLEHILEPLGFLRPVRMFYCATKCTKKKATLHSHVPKLPKQ